MAEVKKITLARKLEASTLVEVLIAMVIIMAVFVSGMAIFVNVTQSGVSISRLKAQERMSKMMEESVSNADWHDQVVTEDSIFYQKSVVAYPAYPDLLLIEIKAKQNDTDLGEFRQVVKKEEDEDQ